MNLEPTYTQQQQQHKSAYEHRPVLGSHAAMRILLEVVAAILHS